MASGDGWAEDLPSPQVLVIEEKANGNVFLYRLTRYGRPCGDTWLICTTKDIGLGYHRHGEDGEYYLLVP